MVDAKYFSFTEPFLFILFLFELLKFQMPTKTFHNYNFMIIVQNTWISFWLESAFIELFHLLLSSFHRDSLVLFLQFGSYTFLILRYITSGHYHSRHTLVLPCVFGMCLWLKGQLFIFLFSYLSFLDTLCWEFAILNLL